jgi:hypothetical protein
VDREPTTKELTVNATAAEHADWHYANGPSGPYGVPCPWDACGYAWADDAEQEAQYEQELAEYTAAAPALREGESPAPIWMAFRPDWRDAPTPWGGPFYGSDDDGFFAADEPPF